jgi:GNAT superfamily N-acetyltransferase
MLTDVPSFAIRPASPSDASAIAGVQQQTWAATYTAWIPDIVAAFDPLQTAGNWARAAGAAGERVAVAADHTHVVGYAWSRLTPAGAELAALCVLPSAQGRGAGRALVADALHWAAQANVRRWEVWALAAYDPARRFYERQGFVQDSSAPAQLWRGMPQVRYVLEQA